MTQLRTPESGDGIPYAGRAVTLIRTRKGVTEFAKNLGEKRDWANDQQPKDLLFVAWAGNWSTDIFSSDPDELRAAFAK